MRDIIIISLVILLVMLALLFKDPRPRHSTVNVSAPLFEEAQQFHFLMQENDKMFYYDKGKRVYLK